MRSLAYLAKRLGEMTGLGTEEWLTSIALSIIGGAFDHKTKFEHVQAKGLSDLVRHPGEHQTEHKPPPLNGNQPKINLGKSQLAKEALDQKAIKKDFSEPTIDRTIDSIGIMLCLTHFDIQPPHLPSLGFKALGFKPTDDIIFEPGGRSIWEETLLHKDNQHLIEKVRVFFVGKILQGIVTQNILYSLFSDILIDVSDFLAWAVNIPMFKDAGVALTSDIRHYERYIFKLATMSS